MRMGALGEFGRTLELGLEAEQLAKRLDDPRREALVHCLVSVALSNMGRSVEGIGHGERAMAIAESLQDPMLRIAARHPLGRLHCFLGAYRTAISSFQRDVGLEPEQVIARLLEPSASEVLEEAAARDYSYSEGDTAACWATSAKRSHCLVRPGSSPNRRGYMDMGREFSHC